MKVSMNSIGNYSPSNRLNPGDRNKVNQEPIKQLKAGNNSMITEEEKQFFSGLYPESKNEISDYHFYQKSGKMSGVKIGSQLDRKG